MRVEVIKKFKDKHTGKMRRPGDICEITEERYAEIAEAGEYVALIAEDGAGEPETAAAIDSACETENAAETILDGEAKFTGEAVAVPELEDMTVAELKEYGKTMFDMEFERGMKKAAIIEAIRNKEEER